jgi:beta-lactamase regulating signal transducer with metallopeptidase domain
METISRYLLTFLLNSLWQIPLIAAVAALACRLMRNGPPGHRHSVWVAALLAAVLLPLASVRSAERAASGPFPAPAVPQRSVSESASPTASSAAAALASTARPRRTISYAQTTATILVAAYLLFLRYRLAKLAWAWMRTVQIRDAAGLAAAPSLVRHVWERCLQAFGLRDVELLCSMRVPGPVAAGAWRRIIILPESLFGAASEEVLTTAIGHEMAHLARHDFALNVLYELLYLPVAFHPASWPIVRGIAETREMACDELVTRKLLDADVYARSIVSIAASMTALPRPGYTLGVFDGDILEQRIRRLLHRPAANLKRARLLLAAGLSALALCAVIASGLALTAGAQSGDANLMKQAVDAFNRWDYKQAASQFESAIRRDPGNLKAKLYFADALSLELQEYGPAADTGAIVSGARQQYLEVLARDATNQHAMQGMMALATRTSQLAEAREWALRVIQADPADATAYYTAAYVDWAIAYPAYAGARQAAGMNPQDPGIIPDEGLRQSVRTQHMARIEEGLRMLQTAVQIDPGYSEAMAYMSLLYRIQAGVADSERQSAALIAKANNWVMAGHAAQRQRAGRPRRVDVDGAAPLPPSPPPPPPGSYYLGPR